MSAYRRGVGGLYNVERPWYTGYEYGFLSIGLEFWMTEKRNIRYTRSTLRLQVVRQSLESAGHDSTVGLRAHRLSPEAR